jgi:hypothetical protein
MVSAIAFFTLLRVIQITGDSDTGDSDDGFVQIHRVRSPKQDRLQKLEELLS